MSASAPFADSRALIFGGGKGIGRAVAIEWARRGATLAIADIDIEAAQATAEQIEADGGRAVALAADVLDDVSVMAAVQSAGAQLGELDILMNNVGATLNGHPEDIPLAEWQRMMDLNYFGALRGIQAVLPGFLTRGHGHIVCTASFAGFYPYAASRIPYATAKAAVISLCQNLAIYCEPHGVRVSCLIPGPVLTEIMDTMTNWTENCQMRGPGASYELLLPEDVAIVLADGMRDGKVMIPSDPDVWTTVERWADGPDAFIAERIATFASGEVDRPRMSDAVKARLAAAGHAS